jgi:hypothetical protein
MNQMTGVAEMDLTPAATRPADTTRIALGPHAVLKGLRKIHLYLGVFTAPALLFFAFTGALQTFSLHETTQGSSYTPPAWVVALAQLHKKQTPVVPVRKARPADRPDRTDRTDRGDRMAGDASKAKKAEQAAGAGKASDSPKPKGHLPMKIFFLVVAVGLFVSTLTGIYMAYRYNRGKLVVSGLLAAGIVAPLLLLGF